MHQIPDDNAKRRLTEPQELAVVADLLLSRGFTLDEIPVHLSRYYYVDIDMLNEILFRGALPSVERAPVMPRFRKVA